MREGNKRYRKSIGDDGDGDIDDGDELKQTVKIVEERNKRNLLIPGKRKFLDKKKSKKKISILYEVFQEVSLQINLSNKRNHDL